MEVDYPHSDTLKTNTAVGNAEAGIYIFTEGRQTGFVATPTGAPLTRIDSVYRLALALCPCAKPNVQFS